MGKKVLIFGIDGGTWKILRPLMKMGLLPTLSQLVDEGDSGILYSTLPPVTAPAWTTFQTGVSPLKHGIMDFLSFDRSKKTCGLINASNVGYPTLWQLVSRAGMKVISINVPVTYPPKEINGYMISGILTPSTESTFTYPIDLKEEILGEFGEYTIFVSHDVLRLKGFKKFVGKLIEAEELRTKVALWLMNKTSWNLLMIHNQSSDSLQHAAWPFIDPEGENFNFEMFEMCIEFYKSIDENINQIINQAGEAAVIIMSDHGFGPLQKVFNINRWLLEEGFLKLRTSTLRRAEQLVRKLDKYNIARKVIPVRKREKIRKRLDFDHYLDWNLTKAFVPYGSLYACLFVNSKDKGEIKTILDELSEKVLEVKDPETGNRVVNRLIMTGNYTDGSYSFERSLPDAIIEPENGYSFNSSMAREALFYTPSFRKGAIGRHEMEGIVIFNKEMALSMHIKGKDDLSIGELTPMILSYLGIPLPFYMVEG